MHRFLEMSVVGDRLIAISIARGLLSTLVARMAPRSVNAQGSLRRPPRPGLDIAIGDIKAVCSARRGASATQFYIHSDIAILAPPSRATMHRMRLSIALCSSCAAVSTRNRTPAVPWAFRARAISKFRWPARYAPVHDAEWH